MTIDTILYETKGSETRIALLSNGVLEELDFINSNKAAEGNIYLGRVTHKLDLAHQKVGFFVDINDSREAFLNADEIGLKELSIAEGQSIVVQVAQEQRAEKGAKVVRAIQLVGEHIVYCPYRLNVEVSPRIEDKATLEEYKELVIENTTGQEGWILRTTSVEVPFKVIAKEMEELRAEYEAIRIKARNNKAPSLLYTRDNPLFGYIKQNHDSLQKVILNSRNVEAELKEKFGDDFEVEINSNPFEEFGIEEAISEALEKTVNLAGGGRVIIEETRACVAIDVDSGGDDGHGGVSRLNNDAAYEIARQIRLRNLAGKIVIDFAGSSDYKFLKSVIDILEEQLAKDNNKSRVLGLSRAGNVEIVRVRRRPSLSDVLTMPCETCQGTGRVSKDS